MAQRNLKIRSLEGVIAEVKHLRQLGYHQQGHWDLGQISRHLSRSMDATFDGMESPVPFYLKIIGPLFAKRMILARRRMGGGIKAPREFQPPKGVNEAKEVQSLERAVLRLLSHQSTTWPKHPFLGKMSRSQWLEFHTIHAQHHLAFLSPK